MNIVKVLSGINLKTANHGEPDRVGTSVERLNDFSWLLSQQDGSGRGPATGFVNDLSPDIEKSGASAGGPEEGGENQEEKGGALLFAPFLPGLSVAAKKIGWSGIPAQTDGGEASSTMRAGGPNVGYGFSGMTEYLNARAFDSVSSDPAALPEGYEMRTQQGPLRYEGVSSIAETAGESILDLASDAGVQIAVVDFETHFPAAVASALPERGLVVSSETELDHSPVSIVREAFKQSFSQSKILKIRLEPEALGQIEVRMRVGRSHLDIQITPTSTDTLALLDRSRDELVRAIGGAGYEPQNVAVQINGISSTAFGEGHATDGSTGQNSPSFGFSGERKSQDGGETQNETWNGRSVVEKSVPALDGHIPRVSGDVYL